MLLLLLGLGVSGCASGGAPSGEFVGVRHERVGTTTYRVSRSSSSFNFYRVSTVSGRPGSKAGAARAVRRAFGCQRVSLRETQEGWRAAEGRGSLCRGNPSYKGR